MDTQYTQGLGGLGIDRLAYTLKDGKVADVVLIEAKNVLSGPVPLSKFSALGGGARGVEQFNVNLGKALNAIRDQAGALVADQIARALDVAGRSRIVIYGPEGLQVSDDTLNTIRSITGRPVEVIREPFPVP